MITGEVWPIIADWPEIPAHLAAESAILGHILLDNRTYDKVRGKIGPDDFMLDAHKTVFLRMTEMREAEIPVDLITLSDHLAGKVYGGVREIDEVGGGEWLFGLTEGLLRCGDVQEYVTILKEKSRLRRIMAACETAIAKCKAQGESAEEIVGQLGTALRGIRKRGK